MEFLTIHELSRQFDIPARVIRYRLHQLRQAGQLAEGADYRRDNFVDDQHFVWRINPLSFMRETGLAVTPTPAQLASVKSALAVTSAGNQSAPLVDDADTKQFPPVNEPRRVDIKSISPDGSKPPTPGLEREMIDLLKSQVQVKDGQIREMTEQNRNLSDTNLKLIGQTVQQSQKIQDLLRLTGGKTEADDIVTKDGSKERKPVNHSDNQSDPLGNDAGSKGADADNRFVGHDSFSDSEQGSARAA